MDKPEKIRDGLWFIIDILASKSYKKPPAGGRKTLLKEDVHICSIILRKVVRYYDEYLKYLEGIGVFVKIREGKRDESCTVYTLNQKFINKGVKRRIIYDQSLVAKIYKGYIDSEAIKKYSKLYNDLLNLEVDWNHAKQILDMLYGSESSEKNIDLRQKQVQVLRRIEDPLMATFKKGRTNRLTTTLALLRKELREALRYDGKSLVSLDLKNSIPFFTLALLDKETFQKQRLLDSIRTINPRLFDRGGITNNKETHSIMLSKMMVEMNEFPDVLRYKELVLSGKIYEEVMEVWNQSEKVNKTYTRASAKKKLLKILNAQEYPKAPEEPYQLSEKVVLIEHFPNLMPAFFELNTGFTKKRNGKGRAKWKNGDSLPTFAFVTQKLEAKIVLDDICGRLATDHPEIPIFTLHDSLFTIEEYIDTVKTYMEDITYEQIGYKPKIEVERNWGILKRFEPHTLH